MKKNITIILTILSGLLILDSLNFSHAIMMFLLAGIVPGTNIAIDGAQMLEIIVLIAGFTTARLMAFVVRNFKLRTQKTSTAHA